MEPDARQLLGRACEKEFTRIDESLGMAKKTQKRTNEVAINIPLLAMAQLFSLQLLVTLYARFMAKRIQNTRAANSSLRRRRLVDRFGRLVQVSVEVDALTTFMLLGRRDGPARRLIWEADLGYLGRSAA